MYGNVNENIIAKKKIILSHIDKAVTDCLM